MKIHVRRQAESDQVLELHFDRRLPEFPVRLRRVGPFTWTDSTIDGRRSLAAIARRMARLNQGRLDTELVAPAQTFLQLLEQLIFVVPGVVSVSQRDRYSISVQYGLCFEPLRVSAEVASAIVAALWPGEPFDIEMLPTEAAIDYTI